MDLCLVIVYLCVVLCCCLFVCCAGIGGRLGTGSSLGSYVRKIRAVENVELDEDPREALLKYAKVGGLRGRGLGGRTWECVESWG